MDMNAGAVNMGVGAVDMAAVNVGDEDAGMEFAIVHVKLPGRNVGG